MQPVTKSEMHYVLSMISSVLQFVKSKSLGKTHVSFSSGEGGVNIWLKEENTENCEVMYGNILH